MSPLQKNIENRLLRYSVLIKKLHQGAHGKDVHELRTLSRKLHADLWILKTSSDIKVPPSLLLRLKKLTQILGQPRQLHVLCKEADRYSLSTEKLKKKRDRSRQKVKDLVSKKWQLRLYDDFHEFERHLVKKKMTLSKTRARKRLQTSAFKIIKKPLPISDKKWHEQRIAIRKLQYRMEVLGLKPLALAELQKDLGKAHDLHLLHDAYPEHQRLAQDEIKALAKAQRFYQRKLQKTLKILSLS